MPIDMEARYSVASMPGVAFYIIGPVTEWTEERWTPDACDDDAHVYDYDEDSPDDPETHQPHCYVYNEPEEIPVEGRWLAVMVGDDRRHEVDESGLTVIGEGDYCGGCGQIGCHAYG